MDLLWQASMILALTGPYALYVAVGESRFSGRLAARRKAAQDREREARRNQAWKAKNAAQAARLKRWREERERVNP
jgi:hypothetical protein